MKRRRINNNNGNYRKNNSKHNQQRSIKPKSNTCIPSYKIIQKLNDEDKELPTKHDKQKNEDLTSKLMKLTQMYNEQNESLKEAKESNLRFNEKNESLECKLRESKHR